MSNPDTTDHEIARIADAATEEMIAKFRTSGHTFDETSLRATMATVAPRIIALRAKWKARRAKDVFERVNEELAKARRAEP